MKRCRNQRGIRVVATSAQLFELYTVSLMCPAFIESDGPHHRGWLRDRRHRWSSHSFEFLYGSFPIASSPSKLATTRTCRDIEGYPHSRRHRPSASGRQLPLNAALGTDTATILSITSDQRADQNPPEQLITSAAIRTTHVCPRKIKSNEQHLTTALKQAQSNESNIQLN